MAAWCDYFCWSERDEAIDFDGVAGYDWTLTEAVAPVPSEGRAVSGSTPVAVGVLLLGYVDRVIESLAAEHPLRGGAVRDERLPSTASALSGDGSSLPFPPSASDHATLGRVNPASGVATDAAPDVSLPFVTERSAA